MKEKLKEISQDEIKRSQNLFQKHKDFFKESQKSSSTQTSEVTATDLRKALNAKSRLISVKNIDNSLYCSISYLQIQPIKHCIARTSFLFRFIYGSFHGCSDFFHSKTAVLIFFTRLAF